MIKALFLIISSKLGINIEEELSKMEINKKVKNSFIFIFNL